MELIKPVLTDLEIQSVTPGYAQTLWASGTVYKYGDKVRYEINGQFFDFTAAKGHTASATNSPAYYASRRKGVWTNKVLSQTITDITYTTNLALSLYADWQTGVEVLAGAAVHDPQTRRDYVALEDISAVNNTIRPSVAVDSLDSAIAARWLDNGAANAWGSNDPELNTSLLGIAADGSSTETQFTLIFPNISTIDTKTIDRIFVAGMADTAGCEIEVIEDGVTTNVQQIAHNAILDPVDLSASTWTLTNLTRAQVGGVSNGVTTEIAWELKETAVTGVHHIKINYAPVILKNSRFSISFMAKPLNARNLDLKITFVDKTGAVIDNKTTHCIYKLATSAVSISSDSNLSGYPTFTYTAIYPDGNGWYKCHFSGISPVNAATAGMVVAFGSSGQTTAPLAASADPTFLGVITKGIALSSIQIMHGLFFYPWSEKSGRDRFPSSYIFTIPNGGATKGAELGVLIRAFPGNVRAPLRIGLVGGGTAVSLGNTEWNVQTSYLSFSRKERNETFGTVSFLRRGSSKTVSATCIIDTDSLDGDTVQKELTETEGSTAMFDFNNTGSDYDRLRVYGFLTNYSSVIAAGTWESYQIEVEGLVEQ